MRKLIILIALLNIQIGFASEWDISVDESKGQVSYSKEDMKFTYPQTNVAPKVKEIKEVGGLKVVIFHARSSGSFLMFEEWHGAVFEKNGKLKGIYPYEYEVVSEETSRKINQPKWKIKGKTLTITEPELDETYKIQLP